MMRTGNAFQKRDVLVIVAAGACGIYSVVTSILGNTGIVDWLGGIVYLCLVSIVLYLVLTYSRHGIWLLLTVVVFGVAGAVVEMAVGPPRRLTSLVGLWLWLALFLAAAWSNWRRARRTAHTGEGV